MQRRARLLRPRRFDDLGLRHALSDRMLPALVGAMAVLAALAWAGAFGAARLAAHWRAGVNTQVTVQVPRGPGQPAPETVARLVATVPGVVAARLLDPPEVEALVRPWLGGESSRIALVLPAVIEARLRIADDDRPDEPEAAALATLTRTLETAAPTAMVEAHAAWAHRLAQLAHSLQMAALIVLGLVAAVAALVIAIATRGGLVARREAIEIVHDLGAPDGYIIHRFARRATVLSLRGAAIGTVFAAPILAVLGRLIAPLAGGSGGSVAGSEAALAPFITGLPPGVPAGLVWILPALPLAAATIGWLSAAVTVRSWLRHLA